MNIVRVKPGPHMSQAVAYGGFVFVAGQVASDEATVKGQTRLILAQIDQLLAEAGTSKEYLLSASIWLANMDTFAEVNAVWDEWIPVHATPARATVEARLASPEYRVEIAAVAARFG